MRIALINENSQAAKNGVICGHVEDPVKGAVAGEKFQELFFANCKCGEIAAYVKSLL